MAMTSSAQVVRMNGRSVSASGARARMKPEQIMATTAVWKMTCRHEGACDGSFVHVCTSCATTSVMRYSGTASCSDGKTTLTPCARPKRSGWYMSKAPVAEQSARVRTADTPPDKESQQERTLTEAHVQMVNTVWMPAT